MPRGGVKGSSATLHQLKITLERVRPPIWRRVLVSSSVLLPELSRTIQLAMGWHGGHLHAFRVGAVEYGDPCPGFDMDDMKDETKVRLHQIAPAEKSRFRYQYDFGDDWSHLVVVERIIPADVWIQVPLCMSGKRACPPEDCGGPWRYVELLAAISGQAHPDHDADLGWAAGLEPEAFDRDAVNAALRRELY